MTGTVKPTLLPEDLLAASCFGRSYKARTGRSEMCFGVLPATSRLTPKELKGRECKNLPALFSTSDAGKNVFVFLPDLTNLFPNHAVSNLTTKGLRKLGHIRQRAIYPPAGQR